MAMMNDFDSVLDAKNIAEAQIAEKIDISIRGGG